MQNPQLLEELLALLKQSEGFQSLPASQQEMIIRTYENATDPQIERAIQEFTKTEDKVEHLNHKEEKLITKEMKIEQKVEKLEKKKTKLVKKEMEVVNKTVVEVSKHQMTIDDLTGEKTAEISVPSRNEETIAKVLRKAGAKKSVKELVEKPKKNVSQTSTDKKKRAPSIPKKNTSLPSVPVRKSSKTLKKVVQVPKKPSEKTNMREEKKKQKNGFFGFIKKKFFGGK